MALSLDKISEQAPGLLSLAKTASQAVDLSGLNGQKAKVAVALDYSGSMNRVYSSGAMQRLVEKALALATQFDDDGAIDFFIFDSKAAYLGEISIDDFAGSVGRLTKGRNMGSTNYADAFLTIRDHFGFAQSAPPKTGFFGLRKAQPVTTPAQSTPADLPVYVLFLTDGAPDNESKAVRALTEVSTAPIFWKFLSIGSQSMAFLEKLDTLTERFVDNANYEPIGDVDAISDAVLFNKMLTEFPDWLKEARNKDLIQ
ncbi:VWA domain-containing protein [Arthrobacter oryzae]|uniref:TerF-like vWA domain-containing protein n=1 Tax=Arthrobacter oryzae TaxID=409290 RepID=A0A495E772_9MICC|nr:VWA domain-containing protein [Arthrobacter oryzae]RKR12646.1 TerF-like vWA domain-containing protein [Arthrobacter oryzae]